MVQTLKEFSENKGIEYFTQKSTIESLMAQIGINSQKFTGIESTNIINDDRFSVLFNTIKDGHGNKGNHIIDVISGEPTWQQMMDVTFGAGAECDSRIIIYDNAAKSYDKVSNRETAVKFASINNECGVDTYIVNAALGENREGNKIDVAFDIETSPEVGHRTDYYELPSKEEFEQAEFWLYFDEYGDPAQEMIYDPDWWFGGPMTYFIDGIIGVTPSWCSDGFYVKATADNFMGHQMLIELIDNKRDKIEQHFDKYELRIKREPDTPFELTVKFDDRLYKEFTLMNLAEKCKYIEKYQNIKGDFSGFLFDELFEDIAATDQNTSGESTC